MTLTAEKAAELAAQANEILSELAVIRADRDLLCKLLEERSAEYVQERLAAESLRNMIYFDQDELRILRGCVTDSMLMAILGVERFDPERTANLLKKLGRPRGRK